MGMMLLLTSHVLLRYTLNKSIPSAYEFTELLMIGVFFLGLAYAQARRVHIRIDFLFSRLNSPLQRVFDLLFVAIAFPIYGVITWQVGVDALEAWRVGDIAMGYLKIPLWPAKAVLWFGFLLFCIRLAIDIFSSTRKLPSTGPERLGPSNMKKPPGGL